MATANDLRRGMAINRNGDIAVVLDMEHRTPGNLRAFVQVSIRSIKSGKSSDIRFSSTEKVEIIPLINKKMEYSYFDGTDYVFSDPVTFETVNVTPELIGKDKDFLVENAELNVTFIEERIVLIELPPNVVLEVTDAPEGIRGDSTGSVQKTITLETGISIQAPLFIKLGEKVKVDTRTRKYMERVKA